MVTFPSTQSLIDILRYLRAQMGVKRIVSVKESPLISHFNDTINGVITIRAFSCQQRFLAENLKRIDDYTLPYVHHLMYRCEIQLIAIDNKHCITLIDGLV